MKVVTNFSTLMKLAYELGKAKQSGGKERIAEAKERHDDYKDLCLSADEMVIPHVDF